MNEYRRDWVTSVTSSEEKKVTMGRFFGTDTEIKKLLVSLAEKDRLANEDTYDYGTWCADDVECDGNHKYSAYSVYTDHRVVYVAEELSNLNFLTFST